MDAQRTAMRRQAIDVEHAQAMAGQHTVRHQQREIREVLVVDRVELALRDQAKQVGEFHRDGAARLQQDRQACDEIVEVRHVRQHIVGADQVGLPALSNKPSCGRHAEERNICRHALAHGDKGDVRGRLHAQHGDATLAEILQQVAIVARQFHHQRVRAQPQVADHARRIRVRVAQPGIGERREIQVIGEDGLRRCEFLELHQETVLTDIGVQRIVRLHCVELFRRQETIRQRRPAEIDEAARQCGGAEATGRRGHDPAGPIAL